MSKDIRISKGLDIKLVGEADKIVSEAAESKEYAIVPDDFHGIIPRLIKREGDQVKAGEAVFHSKMDDKILFPSPVSGTVKEVRRGEKRKILAIVVEPDGANTSLEFTPLDLSKATAEEVKQRLLEGGCWPFVKQRPYDVIANPEETPKAIFISGYNSAPLAPDADYLVEGKERELQAAIDALGKLTSGKIHLTIGKDSGASAFSKLNGVELHKAYGPHPVGNVSTQIAKVDPINKGERIWVVKPEDLVTIGDFLLTGKLNLTKLIAVNGGQVENPKYVRAKAGAKLEDVLAQVTIKGDNNRIIKGNPISGEKATAQDYVGAYTNQVVILEEGNDYDFFGWALPRANKFSVLRANMFSFLSPNKKYNLSTNTNGEQRAFVLTGEYEKVFPLDIYPMQLLKSCLYKDLDEMEALGIYEVAPEDFALTEFICVSKIPHQQIIREGLDVMNKEVG
ncbi:Na(+)-translocating NADH-quinone reductase subunit A [Ornithobacterium rhinotracheale]|uniref:Na(+)-translocating NADH-quinone reductase subunit A n=1 Tax=Ornithobacterium rhinotracheale (strain ATCC 51463 / DSM 15997 / CCUG 23171 / CIP 104009 / LMG 9086) TaxID=867902 RepID=I3ZXR4_ORNRL|nr:Na(+)-translocating NADH-quinone reductase subunit A [Ornithobacterium rhinotracheale]AFL96498.1 NADH:ubiquinone oxidoreductase, Na(+)-translocating, A subunit [Ornithobacterium rhinotracheale DSM 15997]AIP98702.1 Na(+)-translocating NADH-quinone reductase subunit A [Ornithobacterium rhinotracheale ORT-UMN 88]KGB67685.1 Na(+)-translocating NADH-quinone reductase subunit A [Ornithobacterium rhinotracheale H06-030791]MCK0194825.1 Na(+)-translocating NADH-quinone reductase subunit A [Ornithobac